MRQRMNLACHRRSLSPTAPRLRRLQHGAVAEDLCLLERPLNALDLLRADFNERRTHRSAWDAAEQNQRRLHAIVHIDERIGVERRRQWMETVVERARAHEIISLDRRK